MSLLLVGILLAIRAGITCGQEFDLQPPGAREFVSDHANLLNESAIAQIRTVCDQLLTDKATPIIVVTIESMAQHGGVNMPIETFAALLFNQWQIGHKQLEGQDWNTGILLLVSREDRKARIELGAGWGRTENQTCRQIMDEYMVPAFRQGDFSAGIVSGVQALDKMARRLALPSRPRSAADYFVPIVFSGLVAFTVVSLYRRGASGWAWLFWGAVFAALWLILRRMSENQGESGGSFSGGSFGGGSSGGGGASGSW